eukprot:UN12744
MILLKKTIRPECNLYVA